MDKDILHLFLLSAEELNERSKAMAREKSCYKLGSNLINDILAEKQLPSIHQTKIYSEDIKDNGFGVKGALINITWEFDNG